MGLGMGAPGHVTGSIVLYQLLKTCPGGRRLFRFVVTEYFLADVSVGTGCKDSWRESAQ